MRSQLHVPALEPQRHISRYPLNRRLDRPQSQAVFFGEKKNLLPLPEIERFLGRPARGLTAHTILLSVTDKRTGKVICGATPLIFKVRDYNVPCEESLLGLGR